MAKTRQQKQEIVESLTDKLSKAKLAVFVNFNGLKVKDVEELRKKCLKDNVDYFVAKKTLMNLALEKAKMDIDTKSFEGSIALVFGYDDEVQPAKIVEEFAKDNKALRNVGGILEGGFVNPEKIIELSKLPTKQELLARIVGSIRAPISGFVNVLSGNLKGLVQVLKSIQESK